MLISFIITCLVIELTPGPNMVYLAILSLNEGKKAGYAATAGIALGLMAVGIIAALGIATLISNYPPTYQALRYGGTIYLIWLAWDTWKPQSTLSTKELHGLLSHSKYFKRGLITNLLNPKAAVFYIAILPKFIEVGTEATNQAIIMTFIYIMIATSIHGIIVTLAGTARNFIENEKQRLIIRKVMACALIIIALWFLIKN